MSLFFLFIFVFFFFFFFSFLGFSQSVLYDFQFELTCEKSFFLDVAGGALLGPLFLLFFLSFLFLVFFFFWTYASDERNSALSSDHLGPEHSQPSPPPSPPSSRHVRSLRRQASSKAFRLCWAVPRRALPSLPPRAAREQASAFIYTHFRWRSTLSTVFEGLGVL